MAKVARSSVLVLDAPKAARNQPRLALSQTVWASTERPVLRSGATTEGGQRAFNAAACVRKIGRGNEDAARELMDRLYPLVLKMVRAYLPRRASEEDMVQTVFMKVFANLTQYSGQVPIEHWVSRIAVNTCLNEIKAQKIRPEWRWADLSEEERFVVDALSSTESEEPAISGQGAK